MAAQTHAISGRRAYGFSLALLACVIWGLFPIAAKSVLLELDVHTVNFYRFALAGALLLPFMYSRRQLDILKRSREPNVRMRMFLCAALLIANYFFYANGVKRVTPEGTQILIQLATILLLLSGVFFFGEVFTGRQWLGCAVFVIGLVAFFHPRILIMLEGVDSYGIGMGLIVLAAVSWTSYAILQKQLLSHMTSSQVMIVIYLLGTAAFLPFAHPAQISSLDTSTILVLVFCGASTVLGAGSFAEALAHLEASRVSAVLATLPLFTVGFMWFFSQWPQFSIEAEPMTPGTVAGAVLVVFGALMVARTSESGRPADLPDEPHGAG